jgi:hypothetical protein
LSVYRQAREATGPCVLLESTTFPGPLARLTLLARDPRAVLVADRIGTHVYAGGNIVSNVSARLLPGCDAPDANILIRSAVVANGRATFHTGGGIVADSDPDAEHQETLHKAEGMRLALQAARDQGTARP